MVIIAAVRLMPCRLTMLSLKIAAIPITPPARIARCGVWKRDSLASPLGRKPARARAKNCRE
ncbi:hypothetical protein D3C81_1860040 [compost metagenome]